ncbi:hypothetical protein [uncultured Brevundimonas sp.]|uniref:hypothetical protein n=1 Tax=uncultured Brevundimonas sp. TaxID=213418 RepID=UPI0030EE3DBC|tara:strand:- start:6606 stop:6980 length:375 start_codon:yes stop_codon:yes gene_type:complete
MIRKTSLAVVLAASLIAGAASANGMTVQQFLTTAAGIPRNPTAMLRSDTRRLMNEMKGAFQTVRSEEAAARAAGRRPAACMPERVSVNPERLLGRFNAIPAARRNISVTQAIREWMAEEHPCPA